MQDSNFVRWNSAFHHVLVFTVKKRCVLFIDIVEYTLYTTTFLCKNIFSLPAEAQCGLEIKIYSVLIFILNNSAIQLENTKPQNKQMHSQFSPRRSCSPCGYTMKISSCYHRLLIYDVKRTTTLDGMGPFKEVCWRGQMTTILQTITLNYLFFTFKK